MEFAFLSDQLEGGNMSFLLTREEEEVNSALQGLEQIHGQSKPGALPLDPMPMEDRLRSSSNSITRAAASGTNKRPAPSAPSAPSASVPQQQQGGGGSLLPTRSSKRSRRRMTSSSSGSGSGSGSGSEDGGSSGGYSAGRSCGSSSGSSDTEGDAGGGGATVSPHAPPTTVAPAMELASDEYFSLATDGSGRSTSSSSSSSSISSMGGDYPTTSTASAMAFLSSDHVWDAQSLVATTTPQPQLLVQQQTLLNQRQETFLQEQQQQRLQLYQRHQLQQQQQQQHQHDMLTALAATPQQKELLPTSTQQQQQQLQPPSTWRRAVMQLRAANRDQALSLCCRRIKQKPQAQVSYCNEARRQQLLRLQQADISGSSSSGSTDSSSSSHSATTRQRGATTSYLSCQVRGAHGEPKRGVLYTMVVHCSNNSHTLSRTWADVLHLAAVLVHDAATAAAEGAAGAASYQSQLVQVLKCAPSGQGLMDCTAVTSWLDALLSSNPSALLLSGVRLFLELEWLEWGVEPEVVEPEVVKPEVVEPKLLPQLPQVPHVYDGNNNNNNNSTTSRMLGTFVRQQQLQQQLSFHQNQQAPGERSESDTIMMGSTDISGRSSSAAQQYGCKGAVAPQQAQGQAGGLGRVLATLAHTSLVGQQ